MGGFLSVSHSEIETHSEWKIGEKCGRSATRHKESSIKSAGILVSPEIRVFSTNSSNSEEQGKPKSAGQYN